MDAQARGKQVTNFLQWTLVLLEDESHFSVCNLMGESAFGGCQEEWYMSDYTVLSVKFGARHFRSFHAANSSYMNVHQ